MAGVRSGAATRQLEALFRVGAIGGLTDEELVDRFAAGGGEVAELASAVLVERHDPMVLRVCRARLGDEHESEDAFQSTFIVLARRCRSLRIAGSLGPWLYGVAHRVASAARAAARRRRHEVRDPGSDRGAPVHDRRAFDQNDRPFYKIFLTALIH